MIMLLLQHEINDPRIYKITVASIRMRAAVRYRRKLGIFYFDARNIHRDEAPSTGYGTLSIF